MNARERFHATMHYLPRDRCPIMDFGFWTETTAIWEHYGLPIEVNTDSFFGMDPQWIFCGGETLLCPVFQEEIIEDKGDTEIMRQSDGVVVERGKFLGSIPRHLSHALHDRHSWETVFKPRLDPEDPARFPSKEEWTRRVGEWTRPDRDYPLFIGAGSLYGVLRNWLGLEGLSELVYDDFALFEEMVETLADIVITVLEKTLTAGVRPEAASMWEDMCYNSGPLLSPRIFKQVLVPHYQRITRTLARHGVDIVFIDCDGKVDVLAPLWLEAGINTMFPLEVGTWKADPFDYRSRFGKDMRIMGGFDKHILARSKEAIQREVDRLAPLVEEGGYIPMCDHRVPPDVSLDHYLFYVEEAKRVWGKGLPDLLPTGRPDLNAPRSRSDYYSWHLGD
jgi:uroporphyrinogen decarboxylase